MFSIHPHDKTINQLASFLYPHFTFDLRLLNRQNPTFFEDIPNHEYENPTPGYICN